MPKYSQDIVIYPAESHRYDGLVGLFLFENINSYPSCHPCGQAGWLLRVGLDRVAISKLGRNISGQLCQQMARYVAVRTSEFDPGIAGQTKVDPGLEREICTPCAAGWADLGWP